MEKSERWVEFWSLVGIIGIVAFVVFTLMPPRARGAALEQPACVTMETEALQAQESGAVLDKKQEDENTVVLVYKHEDHYDVTLFENRSGTFCRFHIFAYLSKGEANTIITRLMGQGL
jgi:hypothetical protein